MKETRAPLVFIPFVLSVLFVLHSLLLLFTLFFVLFPLFVMKARNKGKGTKDKANKNVFLSVVCCFLSFTWVISSFTHSITNNPSEKKEHKDTTLIF
mmetsp:Transcript_22504/g.46384  ORF Transcript_22504/g.46384 Transcript_22504/m.46384 type:complete len:97 (+) Transcript_22504:167-457(+)